MTNFGRFTYENQNSNGSSTAESSLASIAPDTTFDKVRREVYVFAAGATNGFLSAAEDAWQKPIESGFLLKLAGSASAAAGLAYLSRGQGFLAPTVAKTISFSMGASFLRDVCDQEKLGAVQTAWKTTWNSKNSIDTGMASAKPIGEFAFDATVMTAGGVLGGLMAGHAGGRLFNQPRAGAAEPTVRNNWMTQTERHYYPDGSLQVDEFIEPGKGRDRVTFTYGQNNKRTAYAFTDPYGQRVVQKYVPVRSADRTIRNTTWEATTHDGKEFNANSPGPFKVGLRSSELPSELAKSPDGTIVEQWNRGVTITRLPAHLTVIDVNDLKIGSVSTQGLPVRTTILRDNSGLRLFRDSRSEFAGPKTIVRYEDLGLEVVKPDRSGNIWEHQLRGFRSPMTASDAVLHGPELYEYPGYQDWTKIGRPEYRIPVALERLLGRGPSNPNEAIQNLLARAGRSERSGYIDLRVNVPEGVNLESLDYLLSHQSAAALAGGPGAYIPNADGSYRLRIFDIADEATVLQTLNQSNVAVQSRVYRPGG